MLFSVEPALASDWNFVPSLSALAELTDNVGQAPDSSKESALILGVTPGFSLNYKGSSRLKAALNYSLTGVERFEEKSGNSNDLNHALSGVANAEIVENTFFIDGQANVSQVLTSLLGAPGNGTLNTGNLTTVGTYSISPYLTKRFGTFASGIVRYTTGGALFQNSAISNLNSNTLQASLNSGPRFNDLSWGLNYSLRDTQVQDDGTNQFEHYDATLGYGLTRHIRVFGSLGYDNDDFATSSSVSGRSWTAGLGWSPTRLTSLDASIGDTYFGRTYGFNLSHRTRYSAWTASYKEGTSDISQLLLNTTPFLAWSCNGGVIAFTNTILPPAGQTGCVPIDIAKAGSVPIGLASGVFISKTLQGGVVWSKALTTLALNVFDVRRIFEQITGFPEDETRGVTATYGYRLAPLTTLNASLGYTNNLVPTGLSGLTSNRDDKIYVASFGLTRQFQPKLLGSLTYRYTTRHSNDSASDFNENNLTALVSKTF